MFQGTSFRLYGSHWILSQELFTKKARFSLMPYKNQDILSGNTGTHVRWSWNYLPQGVEPPKQGTDHVIRMDVNNVPAVQSEDFMPPMNELRSRVDFVYSDDYETDPAKFWKNYGQKMYTQVENFVGKRKAIEDAVAQIVSASDPPETKLRKIYARVQELRNTSYEFMKMEEEKKRLNEKGNANVEDVWNHGYGNSTQIDWLFLALARAAGFEAYPVNASNRDDHFFKPANLDISELDSRLVLVKVNGKDVYCDPGAAFTPFGLLDWSETGTAGLRLDKGGSAWITTMMPTSAAARILRKADLTLSDTGDLQGKVTVTFTGLEAMKRRREGIHDDDSARKKYLEDDLKSQIAAASQVELSSQPDWKSSESPLVAEFKVKIPSWVSNAGGRALIPVGLFGASEKGLFRPEQRVHPIYFAYPSQRTTSALRYPPMANHRVANRTKS